jgi:hypothetical protein
MGEGQYDLPDEAVESLNALDTDLEQALASGDDTRFRTALTALLARVRAVSRPIPVDVLEPSDAVLPAEDAHVDDVRDLLGEEGLIPG